MRIGQLSKETGVSIRAIRHYDEIGLLGTVREQNQYRSFSMDDVERVRLIQILLGIGFTLTEIRQHAPCWQHGAKSALPQVSAEEARAFAERKLKQLDQHIDDVAKIRSKLQEHLDNFTSADGQITPIKH